MDLTKVAKSFSLTLSIRAREYCVHRSFYFLVPEDKDKEKNSVDRIYRKLKRSLNSDKIPQIVRRRSAYRCKSLQKREEKRLRVSRIHKAQRKRMDQDFGLAKISH